MHWRTLLLLSIASGCERGPDFRDARVGDRQVTAAHSTYVAPDEVLYSSRGMTILAERNLAAVDVIISHPDSAQHERIVRVLPLDGDGEPHEFSLGIADPGFKMWFPVANDGTPLRFAGEQLLSIYPRWHPNEGELAIVDVLTGGAIQIVELGSEYSGRQICRSAFSLDGARFAVSSCRLTYRSDGTFVYVDGRVVVFDVHTGNLITEFIKEEEAFWSLGFSPDGDYLVAGDYDIEGPSTVVVYSIETGQPALTVTQAGMAHGWFVPNERLLTSPHPGSTAWSVWDISSAELLSAHELHLKNRPWVVSDIAVTRDGSLGFVATSNSNRGQRSGAVFVVSLDEMTVVATLVDDAPSPIVSVELSEDETTLAALGAKELWLWDITRVESGD